MLSRTPSLDFVGRKVEGVPAQVEHRHIKRDAGPQRGLLENHAQTLPFSRADFRPVSTLL